MCGLEASEPHTLPRDGQQPGTAAELSPAGAARLAAASNVMAVGRQWMIPRLEGIPTEYRLFEGIDVAARLAKTLVLAGLADPATWAQVGRDPFRFVEQALKDHVEAHGGPEIEKEFLCAWRWSQISILTGMTVIRQTLATKCSWFWNQRALGTLFWDRPCIC
jgi:hypothetical protein